jgi:site-specific recombinase XerD
MTEWEEESKAKDELLVTLPELSCHWLRHTFATRCCEARLDPKAIQSILGHADYETTMDIYVEATEKYKSQELIYLSDYFDKLQPRNQSASKVKASS